MSSTYLFLNVHLIFATKLRAPMIVDTWRPELHAYVAGTLRGHGANVEIVGGVADHLHVLTEIRATHALADLVREVKKASSKWALERYHQFAWQTGYAAFSVGASERQCVKAYIANQEEHHRERTSQDELQELLIEHCIAFDERYFE